MDKYFPHNKEEERVHNNKDNINIPQNPMLNYSLSSNKNIFNNKSIENLYSNNKNPSKEPINKKQLNKLIEEEKEEIKLNNCKKDNLKCYICLSTVKNPKMCQFCKKLSCSECIKKWLLFHNCCGFCKKKATNNDMISVPFLNDMTTFFNENIENNPKYLESKESQKIEYKSKELDNKIENNIFNETKEKTIRNICQKHNIKYEYYCIQCNNYYCSKCLIFFGEESNSHQKHFFLQTEKMNNLVIKEVINEYQKLPETKNKLEYFIELCNLKLKENIKII